MSLHYVWNEKKRYETGIFINKYNFDNLCHLHAKSWSLDSSVPNVISEAASGRTD